MLPRSSRTVSTLALAPLVVPLVFGACSSAADRAQEERLPLARPPNVIVILADDLGYGELGAYGQTKIRTPELDKLAREGLRFTQAYSASPLCAPSRCALLTGKHTGHAYVRDNKELQPEGQLPLAKDEVTLAELLRERGYSTACIGKWGLGGPGSEGAPNAQGFEHFFGYLCQRHAHDHYPTYLWRNGARIELPGNPGKAPGASYSQQFLADEALAWIESERARPFFLFFTPAIPHAALQAPAEDVAAYRGAFEDAPYDGKQGYIAVAEPHATYAAMVTRLDRDVGRIVAKLEELDLARDTLILFTSDNGPTYARVGGADSDFFESTAGLKGRKGSVYEGGLRVPLLAHWPGTIAPGRVSDEPVASWDFLPTILALVDRSGTRGERRAPPENDLDGVDLSPLLFGEPFAVKRHLYWELASYGGLQAARFGDWKAVRRETKKGNSSIEIYDLARDPNESRDLANEHPELVEHASALFESSRTESAHFRLGR